MVPLTPKLLRKLIQESLHNWFKKEDWVRIASDGSIAGPCGTSKNKKNPDRCLPRAKANSMTKAQRAATARKKKKAGAKGKTVVPNTKKGKVTKGYTKESILTALNLLKEEQEQIDYTKLLDRIIDKLEDLDLSIDYLSSAITKKSALAVDIDQDTLGRYAAPKRITREDVRNYVTGVIAENAKLAAFWTKMDSGTKRKLFPKLFNRRFNQLTDSQISQIVFTLKKNKLIQEKKKKKKKKKKDDRCTRLAKQKYDTWPSAYASGAVVRCRRGEIWKNKK